MKMAMPDNENGNASLSNLIKARANIASSAYKCFLKYIKPIILKWSQHCEYVNIKIFNVNFELAIFIIVKANM
jgi:hypothetical protein